MALTRNEANMSLSAARERIVQLEAELKVTEQLLEARQEVLKAIPECPAHGECVPHALEWIEQSKHLRSLLQGLMAVMHLREGAGGVSILMADGWHDATAAQTLFIKEYHDKQNAPGGQA